MVTRGREGVSSNLKQVGEGLLLALCVAGEVSASLKLRGNLTLRGPFGGQQFTSRK